MRPHGVTRQFRPPDDPHGIQGRGVERSHLRGILPARRLNVWPGYAVAALPREKSDLMFGLSELAYHFS